MELRSAVIQRVCMGPNYQNPIRDLHPVGLLLLLNAILGPPLDLLFDLLLGLLLDLLLGLLIDLLLLVDCC